MVVRLNKVYMVERCLSVLLGVVDHGWGSRRRVVRGSEACEDDRFREHYCFERVMVSVYATGSATKRYHVRDVGLV